MEFNIRKADIHDASVISELSTTTFLETFRGTCTDDDIAQFVEHHFNIEQVSKELDDRYDYYFIAFANDQAIGYLRMKEEESMVPEIKKYRSIELKRIYVLKDFLAKKAGAALMEFALQFATEKKYEAVWLGVWEHNERAMSFYRRWGFTDTGAVHDFPIGNTPQTDHWLIKVV